MSIREMTESRKEFTQQVNNTLKNAPKNALKQRIAQICAGKNTKQFDFLTNKRS